MLHVSNLHIGRIFHDPWQNDAKGTHQRHMHKSAFTFKNGAGFIICIQLDVASCCQKMPKERVSSKIKTVKEVKPVKVKKTWMMVDGICNHLQSSAAQVPATTWLNLIHKHQQLSALSAAIWPNETYLGRAMGLGLQDRRSTEGLPHAGRNKHVAKVLQYVARSHSLPFLKEWDQGRT